jgi:hypothetical protein
LTEPGRRRWLRRIRFVALCSTGVALLAGGAVAGWWGRDRFGTHETVFTVERPITVASATPGSAKATMPSVVGLDRQSALQALADAGIRLAQVSTKEQAYAGVPGIVIAQDPAPESAAPRAPSLILSAPGVMPRLTGLSLDAARTALSQMGATVAVRRRYEAGAAEGSVLETVPAAGQPLAERVGLVVAEAASSVFLDQLAAVQSDCSSDSVYVAGVERPHSLVCQPQQGSPAEIDYVLNRRVTRFDVTLGTGDAGATDAAVAFRLYVDGRLALSDTLPFGTARAVSVPLDGALRLRLVAAVPKQGASGDQVVAVFGAARLVGGSSAIDALTTEAHP